MRKFLKLIALYFRILTNYPPNEMRCFLKIMKYFLEILTYYLKIVRPLKI